MPLISSAKALFQKNADVPEVHSMDPATHFHKYSLHRVIPLNLEQQLKREANIAAADADFVEALPNAKELQGNADDPMDQTNAHLTREQELTIFEQALRLDMIRRFCRFLYSTLFPCFRIVGNILTLIMVGLLADGVVPHRASVTWVVLLPYIFLCVPAWFVIAALRFVDVYVLGKRKEYIMRNVTHVRSENMSVTRMIALFGTQYQIGELWWDCILVCSLIRSLFEVWDVQMRLLFLPLYIFVAAYLVGMPLFGCFVFVTTDSTGRWLMKYPIALYMLHALAFTLLSIQIGLISARVDEVFEVSWQVVLIPTWTTLLVGVIAFLLMSVLVGVIIPYALVVIIPIVIGVAFVMILVIVAFVLLILKLDASLMIPYTVVFIPVVVIMLLQIIAHCGIAVAKAYYHEQWSRMLMKVK